MVGVAAFGTSALWAASQVAPVRRLLLNRRKAGRGPPPEERARSWFKVRFVATTPDATVVTEVAGGDPGYDETAKMLAESAMCLLYDDVPPSRGQVTTAQALGEPLIRRLQAAGISFGVLET
jgi:saccharopine dehydrogenase (NAD+, L-glutamate forming)